MSTTTTDTINAPTAAVLAAHTARIEAEHAAHALSFEYDRQAEARQRAQGVALGLGDQAVADAKRKYDTALAAQIEAEAAVGGRVYRANINNVPALTSHFAKLAKRAAKIDVVAPTLTLDGVEVVRGVGIPGDPGVNAFGEKVTTWRYVIVTGQPVKLAGWEFVATLEHDHDTGKAIIRRVPGSDEQAVDLTAYRNASANCDHCGQDRQRKDTYIVRHEDGDVKQVGSSCLKDFLGHGSPEQYARMAEWFSQLDDMLSASEGDGFEGAGGSSGPALYPTDDFLAYVAVYIRTYGWVARSAQGYSQPTADSASRDMGRALGYVKSSKDEPPILRPEAQDTETAAAALAWVRDELGAKDGLSDYEHNLVACCESDFLVTRRLGIAASAINAHLRHLEREIKRAQRESTPDAGHLAAEGEKVQITGTIARVSGYDSGFGTKYAVGILTDEGHALTWFTGSPFATNDEMLAVGDKVTGRVTVKSHDHFNGRADTHVLRCKLTVTAESDDAS